MLTVALALSGWAGLFAGTFTLARANAGAVGPADPVIVRDGVPVGVADTRAGAVAAAAEYASFVQRTSVLDVRRFTRLVALDYQPAARERVLALVGEARAGDPPLQGIHLLSAVAAARLDRYTTGAAAVSLWLEATYWSTAIVPTQTWALEQLSLRWAHGQWVIVAQTLAQPPVPAWATVHAANDTAAAFDRSLAGMAGASYGGLLG